MTTKTKEVILIHADGCFRLIVDGKVVENLIDFEITGGLDQTTKVKFTLQSGLVVGK